MNISNTYRSANCQPVLRKPKILVKDVTAKQLHTDYQRVKNKQPIKHIYLGFHKDSENMGLEKQIIRDMLPFMYCSNSGFPISILLACNPNKHAIVLYNYQHRFLTDRELSNIFRASKTCRVGVNVPIIVGWLNPVLLLVRLYDIRFFVGQVYLNFVGLTYQQLLSKVDNSDRKRYRKYGNLYYPNNKVRLQYYNALHEILARYKMQCKVLCETPAQVHWLKRKGLKAADHHN